MKRKVISAYELKRLIDYNPETGVMHWKVSGQGRKVGGQSAGHVFIQNGKRKLKITIDKQVWLASKLAFLYMKKGAIPSSESEDALHIAVATVNRIGLLASWNFKHIVSIGEN